LEARVPTVELPVLDQVGVTGVPPLHRARGTPIARDGISVVASLAALELAVTASRVGGFSQRQDKAEREEDSNEARDVIHILRPEKTVGS